ncbi:MAG: hypothetical protein AAB495_03820 [Patescibacteria group bacterium]
MERYRISTTRILLEDGLWTNALFLADAIDDNTNTETLERYFSDLYSVFSSKLMRFGIDTAMPFDENEKLQELLAELIRVRSILEKRRS